jgi:phosphoadenosine phosphosulfate reductase
MQRQGQIIEGKIEYPDKVKIAIARLQEFEPPEGYYLAFSGGKDSIVIYDLAVKSGVKFDAHYNLTTVDPPELVSFIKREYPDVGWNRPKETMWQIIRRKQFLPLRQQRWCCELLKEGSGSGRRVVTGVRWEESAKRAKRRMVENCMKNKGAGTTYLHPIIDWSSEDVWGYIKENNVPYCSLYDEGFKRLGCVCCPMSDQKRDAERWPKIANAYRRAAIDAHNAAMASGKSRSFKDGNEMYEWWISGKGSLGDPDQGVLFE